MSMNIKTAEESQIDKDAFLQAVSTELTVTASCKKMGISRMTVYRWMKDDKSFEKKAREAKLDCIRELNDTCEGSLMKKIHADDMNAIKFWLRYHHEDYKQSYVIAHTR